MHNSTRGHWTKVVIRALRDVLVFIGAYLLANYIRFTALWRLDEYIAPILAGAITLSASVYILGLYSIESQRRSNFLIHSILLTFAFIISFMIITLVGYMSFDLNLVPCASPKNAPNKPSEAVLTSFEPSKVKSYAPHISRGLK